MTLIILTVLTVLAVAVLATIRAIRHNRRQRRFEAADQQFVEDTDYALWLARQRAADPDFDPDAFLEEMERKLKMPPGSFRPSASSREWAELLTGEQAPPAHEQKPNP